MSSSHPGAAHAARVRAHHAEVRLAMDLHNCTEAEARAHLEWVADMRAAAFSPTTPFRDGGDPPDGWPDDVVQQILGFCQDGALPVCAILKDPAGGAARLVGPTVLLAALGSDWACEYHAVTDLWTIRHAGGLWFEATATGGADVDEAAARVIATALLDAVEDGVKGRVVLETSREGEGLRCTVRRAP